MWKTYSLPYLKHNRATGASIITVAALSSMLLSFVSVFFYNLWMDRIYQLSQLSQNNEPVTRLVVVYIVLLAFVSISLIILLHNAFEVTMNSRIHQLGMLQSIGASPRQIRAVLVSEALALSLVPILIGTLVGVALSYVVLTAFFNMGESIRSYDISFQYHPLLSVGSVLFSLLTVRVSAWIPARKISKISPLEAIRYGEEPPVKRMRRFRLFTALFGVYGQLARKSMYARRKAFRTSTISITFACLAFVTLMNFETLSGLSTQNTYFDRHRDQWDFQLEIEKSDIGGRDLATEIAAIAGVENCLTYQKFTASTRLSDDAFSQELQDAGLSNLNRYAKEDAEGRYIIDAPVYVLNDNSFQEYASGAVEQVFLPQPEVVAINIIWDSTSSRWTDRVYIPFLSAEGATTLTLEGGQDRAPVTVAAFASTLPRWKEALTQYSLTLILSEHFYSTIEEVFPCETMYFCIRTTSESENEGVQAALERLLPENTGYTLDSRLEDERAEETVRSGMRIFSAFLGVLFASIGLANVFSTTLGQVYQRRKEFARYMSVGMAPSGIKRILLVEALIVSLGPVLLSVILNIPFVIFAAGYSGISFLAYWHHAPIVPILLFMAFIMFFVGLAYYLGGRKILRGDIMDTLRNDTML
ncbi:ABC transporter permease [Eubacteriales bacterium OttesenSCG-928-N13]|nr:ABC transporter permease [Eubacteriales bacterium OttesenSCG-928-N13]